MKHELFTLMVALALTSLAIHAVEPAEPTVIFNTDFALPSMPTGDGLGTPVCIHDISGLLVAGCDGALGPEGPKGDQGIPGDLALAGLACPDGKYLVGFDGNGDILCAESCPLGFTNCFGVCTDLSSSESNCGVCGAPCQAGQVCSSGTCALSCQSGLTNCSGVCTDTLTSEDNCGGCAGLGGYACALGEICSSGTCVLSCQTGLTNCSGICTDTLTSEDNCGGCAGLGGYACASGEVCSSGICACPPGLTNCFGVCTDLSSSESNCGVCGAPCQAGQVCSSGTCALSCQSGLTNCSGVCTDTLTSEDNCGGCAGLGGYECALGKVCSSGTCVLSCQTGLTNCSGICTDTLTSEDNCGGCGNICPDRAFCNGGNCVKPPDCSNEIVEDGEVCDDGNNSDGDGCSANCLSEEICGNSIVDLINGEQCDDGNVAGGDGCSAICQSEEFCGNGVIGPGEFCDGTNLAGLTCADFGYTGTLACSTDCGSFINCSTGSGAPIINNLNGDFFFYYGGSGEVVLDQGSPLPDAEVTDDDSPNFSGGSLEVAFAGGDESSTDALSIRPGLSFYPFASVVLRKYGENLTFADYSYNGPNELIVSFNENATAELVTDVLRNITFSDSNLEGTGSTRIVRFVMNDGDGGRSEFAFVTITLEH